MNTFAIEWVLTAILAANSPQCCPPDPGHGSPAAPEESASAALKLPLKGVLADCCSQAITEAFKGIANLQSVKVAKVDDRYAAEIVMKKGEGLPLSAVKTALDAANKAMGESMGTKYEIDGALPWTAVHFYRTSSEPVEKSLKDSLGTLKGYKGVWVKKTGFAASFTGAAEPSTEAVRKASGLEVSEVILAPSKDGKRYACPMHPEKVATSAGVECPACGMKMTEVTVSK